jgi:hypothetical protein
LLDGTTGGLLLKKSISKFQNLRGKTLGSWSHVRFDYIEISVGIGIMISSFLLYSSNDTFPRAFFLNKSEGCGRTASRQTSQGRPSFARNRGESGVSGLRS